MAYAFILVTLVLLVLSRVRGYETVQDAGELVLQVEFVLDLGFCQ